MHYEHQGMRLWIEPDDRLSKGTIAPGSNVNLTVGVEPADASNKVQVKYRVNGGAAASITAGAVRHVGNAQYFNAQLPCATLCDGDTVEYSAVCQCAGRQVPSAMATEEFSSSFRVMSAGVAESNASAPTYVKRMNITSTGSSQLNTRSQAAVRHTKQLKPSYLCLFVLERNSGHPIARMPFYAEVGVTSFSSAPPPECKLTKDTVLIGLQAFYASSFATWGHPEYTTSQPANLPDETLVKSLCDALSYILAQTIIDRIAADQTYAASFLSALFQKATELMAGKDIDPTAPEVLRKLLEDAVSAYAKEQNLPLAESQSQQQRIVWAHPLGVLATDHVGYLSFDLTRLPPDVADALALALAARRQDPSTPTETSIWLYPMAREADKIDALSQGRFAHDAIVVKLELDVELDPVLCQPKLCDSIKNLGIMAMQNPSLTDWRLSPGSFAANPGTLVGADGCEMVLPSNIALHEFNFYQVIGLPAAEMHLPIDSAAAAKVRPGFINEYRLSFVPIGHALGQILYSMPLAPGESVNLAVIDWTRRDDAQRQEHTTLDEQLIHNEHRDRTISETVNAAINEYQQGSSFMAGIAGSYGAALGASGMGAAIGLAGSLGGSSSNSSGTRDIAASTVQKLSDNITQASSAMRELHSTVVVHSMQNEHEAIETRTVVNYNHSHSLTILYYEVLRHFRVVTEFVGRRPALLTNIHGGIAYRVTPTPPSTQPPYDDIWWPAIYENRDVLEAALLDVRFKECFDFVERRRHRDFVKKVLGPPIDHSKDPPPPPPGPELRFFMFDMRSGGWILNEKGAGKEISVSATLWPMQIHLVCRTGGTKLSPPGAFWFADANNSFMGEVPRWEPPDWAWKPHTAYGPQDYRYTVYAGEIDMIEIHVNKETADVSFQHITVTAIDVDGNEHGLIDKDYGSGHMLITSPFSIDLPTKRPQPAPPPPVRPAAEIEEDAKILEFTEHLLNNRAHYERVLRLGSTPAQRAFELASLGVGGGASLLEKVDNRPLEVLGDYVAYPCIDPTWSNMIKDKIKALNLDAIEPVERLVTLPTRGVFAEAKLGHCNASEEIDNTRFWKWDEHPIPHSAPEIAAIEAGKHTVINPDLKSTPFPQSLVNIVNPPNAPDPTGLASAMNVLAASNIFRDMSGRAEVADLLKKLSDNSVAIAGVAQKAATGGAGGTSGGGGGGSQPGATTVGTGTGKSAATSGTVNSRPAPGTPQTVGEVNDLASGIRENLPPARGNPMLGQLYQNVVDRAGADANGGLITDPSQLSGSFVLASTGAPFPTGPDHDCFPVSMFQTSNFASGFGTIAERMIENDYCDTFPCSPAITYKDNNNPTEFRQFLVSHNPSLATDLVLAAKLASSFIAGVSRPDIMCDDGTRKDWYEIKPLSLSGAAAGVGKAALIVAFMSILKLPYVAGTTYSPSKDIPIMSGTLMGFKLGVSLNVQRFVPGIVTYTICLTGEVHELVLKAGIVAVLAYIAAVLLPMAVGTLVVA